MGAIVGPSGRGVPPTKHTDACERKPRTVMEHDDDFLPRPARLDSPWPRWGGWQGLGFAAGGSGLPGGRGCRGPGLAGEPG